MNSPFGKTARVIAVFGPFNSRALVEVPAELAEEWFEKPLGDAGRTNAIDAVRRDLGRLAERDPKLAESGIAAAIERLAYELENPHNSATSKSMCAKALRELTDRLLELAPPESNRDELDDLTARRAKRRNRSAAAEG